VSATASGLTRRDFVAAAVTVAGLPLLRLPRAPGSAILFQGDSITDAGRNRGVVEPNRSDALGRGYPLLVASALLDQHPERSLSFFNRGISGNTVPDLAARWQTDTIDLKPDVLSILIGVNDYWHTLNGSYHGTVDDYETGYGALLERTRREVPGVRIVVLEPFVLATGVVTDAWLPEFDRRRAAAARVAQRANATFIPLHAMFQQLSRQAPPAYWAADGVHPTPAGHDAIARAWMQAVTV